MISPLLKPVGGMATQVPRGSILGAGEGDLDREPFCDVALRIVAANAGETHPDGAPGVCHAPSLKAMAGEFCASPDDNCKAAEGEAVRDGCDVSHGKVGILEGMAGQAVDIVLGCKDGDGARDGTPEDKAEEGLNGNCGEVDTEH